MTTTITPGPWEAINGDTFHDNRPWGISRYLTLEQCQEVDGDDAVWPSRTEVIAEVCGGPTAEADAKLMAAAPEMRAALEAFIAATNEQYKREGSTVVHIAPGMHVFEPYMAAVAAVRKATA